MERLRRPTCLKPRAKLTALNCWGPASLIMVIKRALLEVINTWEFTARIRARGTGTRADAGSYTDPLYRYGLHDLTTPTTLRALLPFVLTPHVGVPITPRLTGRMTVREDSTPVCSGPTLRILNYYSRGPSVPRVYRTFTTLPLTRCEGCTTKCDPRAMATA